MVIRPQEARALQGPVAPQSRLSRAMAQAVLGLFVLGCTTPSVAPASGSPNASSTPASGRPTASAAPGGQSPSASASVSSPAAEASFDPAAELDTTFASKIFRPALRVKLPAAWTPVERDPEGFQVYFGFEDYEITIDHTFHQPETTTAAMARLLRPPALTAQGDPRPITIGGKAGLTVVVDASSPVRWPDSGYHINVANLRVRLATIPVEGGETVSIFVVANTSADDFAGVDAIALRILATLEWVAAQ
jgi:hypothetical protein